MALTEDWMVVGHLKEPLILTFDEDASFADLTEALRSLSNTTLATTIAIDGLSRAFLRLMTGGDWWPFAGPEPMAPGMVTWDGRRRRKRRK